MASSEPGTEAGRALAKDWWQIDEEAVEPRILAIEAEAIAAERQRVREAVEGLPWSAMVPEPSLSLVRAAVLAAFRESPDGK